MKGQKKENKSKVKNTFDKLRNHKMQHMSICVCREHIIFNDPHSNEWRLSKMHLEFREPF